MARKTDKIALDGEGYEITQLPATAGLAVYNKLLRVLGPMIRTALAEPAIVGKEGGGDSGLKIASIIVQGFETMDVAFTQELADLFAKHTKVKMGGAMVEMSAGDIFDQHFAGRYAHMTRWMLAHLRLNFSDFLPALASSVAQEPAA